MRTALLPLLAAAASLAACVKSSPAVVEAPAAAPAAAPAPQGPAATPVAPNPVALGLAAALADAGVTVSADAPETCATCHPAVYAEWTESMHSRAHHDADPVYGAMRAFRMEKQGAAVAERCSLCHNPRDVAAPESAEAKTGVSCGTCHEFAATHPVDAERVGANALVRGPPNLMRGPHDVADGTSPVHANGPAQPALVDGVTVCRACHEREVNPAGVETCTTGEEFTAAKTTDTCVSCHMPEVPAPSGPVTARPTHRSHAFLGPHRAWLQGDARLLNGAVALSGRFEGRRFVATLANQSAHGFPSGFPGRMAVLVLRGLDAKGAEVWRNFKADVMAEHPQAAFNKGYVGADGKPSLAPFAVKLVRDNRLKPGETREVAVEVPAQVARVELALKFFLVAPPPAKALGLTEASEAKPKDVATASVAR